MPDTERRHRRGVAAVARLDLLAPPAAPATTARSSCAASAATARDEDGGFTFAAVAVAVAAPRLQEDADCAFQDARIDPVYPVFGRPRWSPSPPKQQQQQQDEEEEEDSPAGAGSGTATVPLERLQEEQGCDCAPSASGQQPADAAGAELDGGAPPETFCLWSAGRCRMSGSTSTGSSVLQRWRRRRRVVVEPCHGHSDDGKDDRFVFLGTSSDRVVGAGEEKGCRMNRGSAARAGGRSSSTSLLPRKQDLVELVVSAVTCRRSCYKRVNSVGSSIDLNDNAPTDVASLCFPGPDPQVPEPGASAEPLMRVDPMLEEFAVSPYAGVQALARQSSSTTDSQEAGAWLLDNHPTPKDVCDTVGLSVLTPMRQPPPRLHHDVMHVAASQRSPNHINTGEDAATTPWLPKGRSSFSNRLKRFTDKILRKTPSPLLPLPEPAVVAQPLRLKRSKRIAAHAFLRVPTAKRDEVLVMKKMGFLDGRTSSAAPAKAQDVYDSIFVDHLIPSHAEAVREFFPDSHGERARHRASRRA